MSRIAVAVCVAASLGLHAVALAGLPRIAGEPGEARGAAAPSDAWGRAGPVGAGGRVERAAGIGRRAAASVGA